MKTIGCDGEQQIFGVLISAFCDMLWGARISVPFNSQSINVFLLSHLSLSDTLSLSLSASL